MVRKLDGLSTCFSLFQIVTWPKGSRTLLESRCCGFQGGFNSRGGLVVAGINVKCKDKEKGIKIIIKKMWNVFSYSRVIS